MTTTPVFSVALSEAVASLRPRAENDPAIQAVLAWVDTRNSDYLRTVGLAYHQSDDDGLRRLSQAALVATMHDSRPANADELTVLLNLSSLAEQRGDSERAFRSLERLLSMRPDWRTHPVIVAYTQKLEAGMARAAASKHQEIEVLLARSHTPQGSWLVTGILLAVYGLVFALVCAWLIGVVAAALPQIQTMRGINPQLRTTVVAVYTWLSNHRLIVSVGVGLLIVADVLARSGLLYVGAQLMSVDYETQFRKFLREYLIIHIMLIVTAVVGYYALATMFGGGVGRAGITNNGLLAFWQVVIAVVYLAVISDRVSSRFSLGGWKALGLVLAMSVAVSVVEFLSVRFAGALLIH